MNVQFIWGLGGVGKTHIVLSEACRIEGRPLVITLDPSQRLFPLCGLEPQGSAVVRLNERDLHLKTTSTDHLFNELAQKSPAQPKVRILYDQMVKNLQEFRDYLSLVELADEMARANFDCILVDTPPLQESKRLDRSLEHLQTFFGTSLVQFAMKGSSMGFVKSAIQRLIKMSRLFVGEQAASAIFEFIEWLTQHADRFHNAATTLKSMMHSAQTSHILVTSPEGDIPVVVDFFDALKTSQKRIVINRSVKHFPQLEGESIFAREMKRLQSLESELVESLHAYDSRISIEQVPLCVMGDDTKDELESFIRLAGFTNK